MKVRVVYRDDGGVSVIKPTGKSTRTFEESCEKAMRDQDDLYGRPYDDIDESELPQSREYRDAWTGSKGIGVFIKGRQKDGER